MVRSERPPPVAVTCSSVKMPPQISSSECVHHSAQIARRVTTRCRSTSTSPLSPALESLIYEINFLLSVVEGMAPRDVVEGMLAAQMAMVHVASARVARRFNRVIDAAQQDILANTFNKLMRTFTTQMDALTRYRSGGGQNVMVGHVSVSEGGQAIVGNVTQGQREAPLDNAAPSQTLFVDAKTVPMPKRRRKQGAGASFRVAGQKRVAHIRQEMTGNHQRNVGQMLSCLAAVPELDRASHADRRPSPAKSAAVCMEGHQGPALRAATKTHSSMGPTRKKPLRNVGIWPSS